MAAELRYDYTVDTPFPPGETVRELLEERGILQGDLAARLDKSEKFVSQLVNGKAPLTHETALELERVLGVPASFWNNAEAQYRDALARNAKRTQYAEQAEWAGSFPLKAMHDNGWIAREQDPAVQTEALLSFFGVSSVDAFNRYWSSERRLAARMSTAYSAETAAIAAWLRAAEIEAESVRTDPYDERRFRSVLTDVRTATRLPAAEWLPLLRAACAKVGVVVVFVPDLPKTRCHAASWWPSRTRAVIALGLRGKADDQVWFSFFHEAAHVLLDAQGRERISDLACDQGLEARMDAFARDLLIPREAFEEFVGQGRPTKASVVDFAQRQGIAPGIVVGRLQHEGVIPYGHLNGLKVRVDWARTDDP